MAHTALLLIANTTVGQQITGYAIFVVAAGVAIGNIVSRVILGILRWFLVPGQRDEDD